MPGLEISHMFSPFLVITLALWLPAQPRPADTPPRKPHPLAPSIPELSEKEEQQLDAIIDRFIDYDTGKLKGAEGLKALREFETLGPEAIPALIRGLNRAAAIEHSCPALVIAKKLARMLGSTKDVELLEFARENIAAGVEKSRHMGMLQDLRVACMTRRNALLRQGIASPTSPKTLTTAQLIEQTRKETGPKLRPLLAELAMRRGDEPLAAFVGVAEGNSDKQMQQLARNLLVARFANETAAQLKKRLQDDRPEIRKAAIGAIAARGVPLGSELIDCLQDKDATVREAARQLLVRMNRGIDYGPRSSDDYEIERSLREWRAWWNLRSKNR